MRNIDAASLCNALIWAVAILAVAIILHWTDNESMVVVVLGGAAGASILLFRNALHKK